MCGWAHARESVVLPIVILWVISHQWCGFHCIHCTFLYGLMVISFGSSTCSKAVSNFRVRVASTHTE